MGLRQVGDYSGLKIQCGNRAWGLGDIFCQALQEVFARSSCSRLVGSISCHQPIKSALLVDIISQVALFLSDDSKTNLPSLKC